MKRKPFRSPAKSAALTRPGVTVREALPKVRQMDKGLQLMCPFCIPPHPIVPGQMSACGTHVKISAVQTVIPARTVRNKNLTCMRCHKSGEGPMVPYVNGYVHMNNCAPDTVLVPPENIHFSKMAERIYKMKPGPLKRFMERRYGHAEEVKGITPEGEETGNVLGYTFMKV